MSAERNANSCPYSEGKPPPAPLTHRCNIQRKLGVHSCVQIGAWIKLKYHGVLTLIFGLFPVLEVLG